MGQQYNVGEKLTVILDNYVNRHATTHSKHDNYKRHDKLGCSSICHIGSRIGWVSMKKIFKL